MTDQASSKVVLVTGAGQRVGNVIARYFANQGYDLAVHYHQSAHEAEQLVQEIKHGGQGAQSFCADLADVEAIPSLLAAVYAHFGRLDVVVNCAAVFEQDHFADFSADALEASWQINCRAPLLLTQAFYQQAHAHHHQGVVINVVDQKVRDNFQRDHFCYTVGKTALGYLTKMLALSAAPTIRVNAVYPGLLLPSDDQTQADFDYAKTRATPLGYIATPLELAQAIHHLTQPCYNGVDLIVDAGQHLVRVDQDVIYTHRAL